MRNTVIGSLDRCGIDSIQIKLQLSLPEYTEGMEGNWCPWITLKNEKLIGTGRSILRTLDHQIL